MVMPEDSPGVKVSAVRDTYGAEARWHLVLSPVVAGQRQVRFCKATQEAREAMSAEIVRELREKHGEEKAEEIHPNQDAVKQ